MDWVLLWGNWHTTLETWKQVNVLVSTVTKDIRQESVDDQSQP